MFGLMDQTVSAFVEPSPLNYLEKVVSSKITKDIVAEADKDGYYDLFKVEKTATYRCPGCFEYSLTFRQRTENGELYLVKKVGTQLAFQSGEILVSNKE